MRTFTICFVLIIVLMAMMQFVFADGALSLSGGVTLTQSTNATSMGSQVDAWCGNMIVATWSSTTSKQLKMPEGLLYKAYSQFTGIRNIERIELTPDDGITRWEARQLIGKGWQIVIPLEKLMRLGSKGGSYGGYGLKWKITSRDKENRLMILFIPITWTSNRASEALNQVVVEQRPYKSSLWCKEDYALYLQVHCGFDSVIPLPDLNFEAQRQAINNYRASQLEQPAVQEQVVLPPKREIEPRQETIEERRPERIETKIDEEPYQEVVGTEPMTIVIHSGSREYTLKASLGSVGSKDTLVFKRGKTTIGTARVTSVGRKVFATMTSGNIASFRRGDIITVKGVK